MGSEEAPYSLGFGGWQDAQALREWSFARRTPQQRLEWLVAALAIAYQCGALKPVSPGPAKSQ